MGVIKVPREQSLPLQWEGDWVAWMTFVLLGFHPCELNDEGPLVPLVTLGSFSKSGFDPIVLRRRPQQKKDALVQQWGDQQSSVPLCSAGNCTCSPKGGKMWFRVLQWIPFPFQFNAPFSTFSSFHLGECAHAEQRGLLTEVRPRKQIKWNSADFLMN